MILTGIIQLLELVVPAFWLMVLLALRTAMERHMRQVRV